MQLTASAAAQVIDGKRPQVPFGHTDSLKKATRESDDRRRASCEVRKAACSASLACCYNYLR